MRIWSFHPKYLDTKGLVALWREALLAQKVLKGETRGYKKHSQLQRFLAQPDPVAAIATYLECVHAESVIRGYRFDHSKIEEIRINVKIPVSRGQLAYEWEYFRNKLKIRERKRHLELLLNSDPEPHPLFRIVAGEIEAWERIKSSI